MKKIKNLFIITVTSLLAVSCNNDLTSVEQVETGRAKDYYLNMGKKLENPYSVKTMKLALENVKQKMGKNSLKSLSKTGEEFNIETTHLYVKFNPVDLVQEQTLESDSTLIVSDYPLDYDYSNEELESMGYDNPNIIGSYYTAVPKDQTLPNVPREILEELYIPEEDPYFDEIGTGKASSTDLTSKQDLYTNLMHEAYKITNNEKQLGLEKSSDGKWWIFGKKWYPSGRITMYDNSLGQTVAVDGAQVLMRQWFTIRQAITDGNGYFSTGFVRGTAKYVLQWERHHYDIRNGWFGQAETHGPNVKEQQWNYNVNGDQNIQFAMIHRAAHHYYYKDIKGLRRAPMYGEMPSRMKIAAIDATNTDINGDFSFWRSLGGILPTIRIYKRTNMSDYYGTVTHELGHASHWKMGWWTFQGVQDNVAESWARGVQWDLTRMVYPNYSASYFGNYTGIVQDLIDNDNSYSDQTSGYSISQIENSLKYQKTWQDWRNKIKQDYDNPTENNLDTVFNYWFNQQ